MQSQYPKKCYILNKDVYLIKIIKKEKAQSRVIRDCSESLKCDENCMWAQEEGASPFDGMDPLHLPPKHK